MTEADVRLRLQVFVAGFPRLLDAAAEIGVSAPFICQILSGQKRASGRVLDALGIERLGRGLNFVTIHRRSKESSCFRLKQGA